MNSSAISIVVPIYKVPTKMLYKCLDSLINQTYKNIEIILVDDGSPDNCPQICDEYGKKDNRIKVIHQKNKGLAGARNTGVDNANGEWITFVDGDDWVEEDGLERVIYKLKDEDDIDVVCFGTIKEYKNSSFKYDFNNRFEDEKVYDSKYFLENLFEFESNISDAHAKLFRRNFLIEENIYHDIDIKQGIESFFINYKAFSKGKKVQFIKEYIYHYAYNNESITLNQSNLNYEIIIKGLNKLEKEILSMNNQIVQSTFYRRIQYIVVTTTISGYFNPSIKIEYKERKKGLSDFVNNEIVTKALNYDVKIDAKRKIVLLLIKFKLYFIIYFLAVIRTFEKEH